jgi:hypothetical protein
MNFDLSKTTGRETYNLLIGLVNPRPIALVTSMDLNGKLNAAPFSAFAHDWTNEWLGKLCSYSRCILSNGSDQR